MFLLAERIKNQKISIGVMVLKNILYIVALLFVMSCDAATPSKTTEDTPKTVIKPVAGIEIENNGSLLVSPKSPNPTRERYWWTHSPVIADFNNDGHLDNGCSAP